MNKDLLKDPCSDALNPSLSKEGNALFIVGGIRWIKRCSWWGWCVASVCVCFFVSEHLSVTTCGLDDIQSASVFILSLHCVCVCVCPPGEWPASVLRCLLRINLWTEPPRKSKGSFIFYFFIGHFIFSLMNVFIGYVIRSSSGWLVKLFNFINLRWNLLCRPKLV